MVLLRQKVNKILRILQILGTIFCTCPRNSKAGKLAFIFGEIFWILAILTVGIVQMGLLCAVYQYEDLTTVMKALSQFNALLEVTLNLILCKWKSANIQVYYNLLSFYSHKVLLHYNITNYNITNI